MKDFNFKQKKSKWLIVAKDCSFMLYVLPVASVFYFVAYGFACIYYYGGAYNLSHIWIMNHWYFGIAGWGASAAGLLYGIYEILYNVLHGILYLIYMYINYVSFRAYLPLTMEDLEANHVKNQTDFIRLLVIYRIKKAKILSGVVYNTRYEFEYSDKDKDVFRELYSQLQPSDHEDMSDEFKSFYDEYLKKYDMVIHYNDINRISIMIGNKKLCD